MTRTPGEKHKQFPDKEARYKCWDLKDQFWACLDSNENPEKCADLRSKYEDACPKTWVKYFDRRKEYLKFQEKLKAGYDPVDEIKSKN